MIDGVGQRFLDRDGDPDAGCLVTDGEGEGVEVFADQLDQGREQVGVVDEMGASIREIAKNAFEAARVAATAVVANEVKELAKETGRKIEAILRIGSISNQINDIQGTIASAVEEQTATTNERSRNLVEVAKASVDITENISSLSQAAVSTSRGASDTLKSSEESAGMATELQSLVGRFTYKR